jgi:hypothetical protein
MWLKDVRPEATVDKTYSTKYMANHYLSWNVSKRFNLGFFESVVWANNNNRSFDMSFVNPIIFYRAVEFASSSRSGNALLGISTKYKWNNQINLYSQFLLDEFALEMFKNKIKVGETSLAISWVSSILMPSMLITFYYNWNTITCVLMFILIVIL